MKGNGNRLNRICDRSESGPFQHRQGERDVCAINQHDAMIVDDPAGACGSDSCSTESVERFLNDIVDRGIIFHRPYENSHLFFVAQTTGAVVCRKEPKYENDGAKV